MAATTLKDLSELITDIISHCPDFGDKYLWTMSEGIPLAMSSVDIVDEGNKRIVVRWVPYREGLVLWTVETFLQQLLSILHTRPELQSETVWRYVNEYTPITVSYIQETESTLCDFILPDV